MRSFLGALCAAALAAPVPAQPPGPPGGPGGQGFPGGMPRPGQILPGPLQEVLNLTPEQRNKLEALQKEVDTRLSQILTPDQMKQLQNVPGPFGGPGFGGPPGGPGFGGGGFMRGPGMGNRLDDVKKQLGSSDEEWKVISPKLQKILAIRQALGPDVRGSAFGGPPGDFGGPGPFGPGPGGASAAASAGVTALIQAQADLKAAVGEPKHTAAEVQQKITAVRQARQKVMGDLTAAQKDLRELLTADQEAVLVSLGYVD